MYCLERTETTQCVSAVYRARSSDWLLLGRTGASQLFKIAVPHHDTALSADAPLIRTARFIGALLIAVTY
jgi:hypothetical protein